MFFSSIAVGLLAGISSGMLGVSPGGVLVPLCVMLLGAEQHTAQALSLVAQIFPSSLMGLRQYRQRQEGTASRSLLWLAAGFLIGTMPGALAAVHTSSVALRWAYVAYLVTLLVILLVRKANAPEAGSLVGGEREIATQRGYHWALIGIVAGLSSGYLGIGGGLAITVGLTAFMGLTQRRAQSASLAVALLPLTVPAALAYHGTSWFPSWVTIGGIVIGLVGGTDLGARLAAAVSEKALKSALATLLLIFAVYMSYTNLQIHPASGVEQNP